MTLRVVETKIKGIFHIKIILVKQIKEFKRNACTAFSLSPKGSEMQRQKRHKKSWLPLDAAARCS